MALRHAVLIGNSLYPEEEKLADLQCPARDVDKLAELLQSGERGGFTTTLVLKDKPSHEVLVEVNRALKGAAKEDLVLIYYSGHGKLDMANRLHLCAINTTIDLLEATSIPVGNIKNLIDVAPPKQVALVLDCCFSGAVGGIFARSGVDDQLQLMSGGRGTYIMSASTGVQVALEKEGDDYSVFTRQIIEGIETGAADVNGDGIVTMDELYNYVHDRVLEDGFQEPMKWGINVRGELVIAKTGKSPQAERRKAVRTKLLELASHGVLPDRILSQAMSVLASHDVEPAPEIKTQRDLLEQLTDARLQVGEFVDAWFTLELEKRRRASSGARRVPRATSAPPAPPQQPPAPPPAPSGEDVQRPPKPQPAPGPRTPLPSAIRLLALPGALWGVYAHEKPNFWRWFGLTAGGLTLGVLLSIPIALAVMNSFEGWFGGEEQAAVVATLIVMSASLGFLQRFGFPPALRGRWWRGTVAGWGLIPGLAAMTFLRPMDFEVVVFAAPIVGLIASIAFQRSALRTLSPDAKWWGWTVIGSLVFASLIGTGLAFVSVPVFGDEEPALLGGMVMFGVTWAAGMAAGLGLLVRGDPAPAGETPDHAGTLRQAILRGVAYAFLAWLSLWLLFALLNLT